MILGKLNKHKLPCVRGFTLIEVTIVIFIILLMTTAVVPWMKTFTESAKLRSNARSIRSLMEFARSCAITERTEYVVLFDPANGEYWLSLLEFLDESSGGSVTDSSRTSLFESLSAREETLLLSEDAEETAGTYSRTGGVLGIPQQLSENVQIAQIISPRSSTTTNEIEYVVFYPDSTAENFELYIQSTTNKTFLLSVSKSTARTSIRELTPEEIEELGLASGSGS